MPAKKNTRLALSFHRTFKPERSYLAALLRYAAAGNNGTLEEISDHTAIPTGKTKDSSGKVLPTIYYCTGMGLLCPQKSNDTYSFTLTPFGRAVLNEDPYLASPLTQWLAHLQLCHPRKGAELWFQTFVEGAEILGMNFSRESLTDYLRTVCTAQGRNPVGPVIGTYTDEAAFKRASVLTEQGEQVHRLAAPVSIETRRGYTAWLAQLLADFFPGAHNISITDYERVCGWKRATGWHPSIAADVLAEAEQLGVLTIDRHMQPWLIDLNCSPEDVWASIYDDML